MNQDTPTDPGKRPAQPEAPQRTPTASVPPAPKRAMMQGWRSIITGSLTVAAILVLALKEKATGEALSAIVAALALQLLGKDIIPVCYALVALRTGHAADVPDPPPEA